MTSGWSDFLLFLIAGFSWIGFVHSGLDLEPWPTFYLSVTGYVVISRLWKVT